MLLRQSPRPGAGEQMLEWLRFSETLKGLAQYGFDQLQDTQGRAPIGLNPETQVLAEFGMKNRLAGSHRPRLLLRLLTLCQDRAPGAGRPPPPATAPWFARARAR